jgi:peptidyl-Lys metalloendopeptidase
MKLQSLIRIRLALLVVTILFTGFVHAQSGQVVEGILSKIDVVKGEFKKTEPVEIRFMITNTTDKQVNILKWHTPLEGFNANIFLVKRDGTPVNYIGRVVKRGTPQPEDYVSIAPGETVTTVVDISSAYEIYERGEYSVEFKSRIFDIGHDSVAKLAAKTFFMPKPISSNTISFRLPEAKERPIQKTLLTMEQIKAKTPVFKNCSQTQQNTINSTDGNARSFSASSYSTLTTTTTTSRPSCERYTYWFGTYDGTRYDTTTNHFLSIRDAFANQTVTYNCACDPGLANAYAYVYPDSPYEIFLCNAFWNAPATGTDSQFGTLVHEMSHFNVVVSTDDHVYGQVGAHNLATTNPSNAIDNADNHEYFSENTPVRQCDSGVSDSHGANMIGFGNNCLDVSGGGMANGTKVQMWQCQAGNTNQQWILQNGNIVWAAHTNKCLDVSGGGTTNGTQVLIWDCQTGNQNQRWSINPDFAGKVVWDGGKCLDVNGGGTTNGTKVQVWDCMSGNGNQNWITK